MTKDTIQYYKNIRKKFRDKITQAKNLDGFRIVLDIETVEDLLDIMDSLINYYEIKG
jgi:hypothetical protein